VSSNSSLQNPTLKLDPSAKDKRPQRVCAYPLLLFKFPAINHVFSLAGTWLLESVESMFNIARIPEPFCDTVSEHPPPTSREARSILVMIHNWCYSMVVYQPSSSENPPSQYTLLQPGEIEAHFRAIVLDVESRLANGEKALPVGVLSADERDRWAEVCTSLK